MAKPKLTQGITLTAFDEIFNEGDNNSITELPIEVLHTFENHPFYVKDDEEMLELVESVKQSGILTPILVRPRQHGGYEIIAGHRRRHAAVLAGLNTIPAIIRELDDDAAVISMVDTNLQRLIILPSERAFAYKMRLDAMKRQAGRPQKGQSAKDNKRSDELLAEQIGESRSNIQRLVRLTQLNKELLRMVDEKKLSVTVGVEISFLDTQWQDAVLACLQAGATVPTSAQVERMKTYASQDKLSAVVIQTILDEVTVPSKVNLTPRKLKEYFPSDYTPKQMEDTILQLLDGWRKNQ